MNTDEHFKKSEPLEIHFEEARQYEPSMHKLKARVNGAIVFLGDYWLTVPEARALRDWLNKVLP